MMSIFIYICIYLAGIVVAFILGCIDIFIDDCCDEISPADLRNVRALPFIALEGLAGIGEALPKIALILLSSWIGCLFIIFVIIKDLVKYIHLKIKHK